MAKQPRLSSAGIDAFAQAVFERAKPWVAEAYSDFDMQPRQFSTAKDLANYVKKKLADLRGTAFLFVAYPEMRGHPVQRTINLDTERVPGHKIRYTWEGWGLISVLLTNEVELNQPSRIAANSEKRALKWESTYSHLGRPSSWNWKEVASHKLRLQRALKRCLELGESA